MVAGACVAALGAGLAWQVGAQARDAIAERTAEPQAASSGAVVLPPVSTGAAPASASLSVLAASAATEDTPANRTLLLRTVPLRAGRRGETYRPLQLVRQLAAAGRVVVVGELPPGLLLGDDGNLRGVPKKEGLFQFQLEALDSDTSRRLAHQDYSLRILAPAVAAAAPPSAAQSAARPTLKTLTENESVAYTDVGKAVPASYQLTSIAAWVPTEEPASPPADDASAVVPSPSDPGTATDADAPVTAFEASRLPTIDQLKAELTPLLDIEYPTQPLFVQALDASRCSYYRAHLQKLARDKAVDMSCPPRAPEGSASGAARSPGDPMSLAQFYKELMPPKIQQQVVDAALKLHPVGNAIPLRLTGDGCGCHVPKNDENVYGIFPFWLATSEVQALDFSLFSHIGFMGAVLQDDGSLEMPTGSTGGPDSFARVAELHETSVDLVVYRRDWAELLRKSPQALRKIAIDAAQAAVQKTDLRFDDATAHWLQPLLLPGWRAQGRVYAGLTVFFDDANVESEERDAFKRFYEEFAQGAIAEMRLRGRSYHLNFVVPDSELGDEDSAYGFTELNHLMVQAGPEPLAQDDEEPAKPSQAGKATGEAGSAAATGSAGKQPAADANGISVFYLVTLGTPTSESRATLRERFAATPLLTDERRVAVLKALVPMVFGTRMPGLAHLPSGRVAAISNDLTDMRWSYGGAGFWPIPAVQPAVDDELHRTLSKAYVEPSVQTGRICAIACPNRLLLRVMFQFALLVDLVALFAYALSCRLRRSGGWQLLLLIWAFGVVALAVGIVVFECDPLLGKFRTENTLLWGGVVIGVSWAAYRSFWPREDPP